MGKGKGVGWMQPIGIPVTPESPRIEIASFREVQVVF